MLKRLSTLLGSTLEMLAMSTVMTGLLSLEGMVAWFEGGPMMDDWARWRGGG